MPPKPPPVTDVRKHLTPELKATELPAAGTVLFLKASERRRYGEAGHLARCEPLGEWTVHTFEYSAWRVLTEAGGPEGQ